MIVPNVTPMPGSCRRKEYDRGVSAHVAGDYDAALQRISVWCAPRSCAGPVQAWFDVPQG